MLLIPSWRLNFNSFFLSLFNSSPNLESKSVPLPENTFEWELLDLKEAEWKSFNEFKGKVIFLNFWATWCGPCLSEMKSIEDLYNKFGDKVEFIIISTEEPKTIANYRKRTKSTLPFYTIANAPKTFQTNKYPTTYIINKKGEIVVKEIGAHDWSDKKVKDYLTQLLKE